jgi:dTDP-4-amino-4,6-dideoxygalactose transaminase
MAAAIGLVELNRYENDTLVKRLQIFKKYDAAFKHKSWAILPEYQNSEKQSSYHIYPLRIKGISEAQRDIIIQKIFNQDVSVNVHFIPIPLLSYYKNKGFKMEDYPQAYKNFSSEISLPVFYNLTEEQQNLVIQAVINAVESIL